MEQPPILELRDDREARLDRGRSGWRAYLVALPVVAAVAAVAFLGVIGPKGTPTGTTRPSAHPTPTPHWTAAPTPSPIDVPGLSTIQVSDTNTVTAALPPDTLPLDADGDNFLYASAGGLYALASNQTPLTPIQVATARPCGLIETASLSGTDVIYSEVVPPGYSGDGSADCPGFGDAVDWYVSITDFVGATRQIASGRYADPQIEPAIAAPDVAIANGTYAFSRPDPSGTAAVVEVHRLVDDTRQYKSVALAVTVEVRLGDGRLVVVSPGPAPRDSLDDMLLVWSTTDWSHSLDPAGLAFGAVALSRDGRRLVFAGCEQDGDKRKCDSLETFEPDVHRSRQLPMPATFLSVDSGPNSHLLATAWISSGAGGRPYIGVDSTLNDKGIALVGMDEPMWVSVHDDALLWLSLAPDGSATLNRLDLLSVISAT
jgi:hypothetical protein